MGEHMCQCRDCDAVRAEGGQPRAEKAIGERCEFCRRPLATLITPCDSGRVFCWTPLTGDCRERFDARLAALEQVAKAAREVAFGLRGTSEVEAHGALLDALAALDGGTG